MTADPDAQNTREEQLHELLAGYYEVAERGEHVDRRDLLDRHPDFAADLADFFSVQDQLHRLAEPLRPQEPVAANGQNGTDRIDPDPLAAIVAELASTPTCTRGRSRPARLRGAGRDCAAGWVSSTGLDSGA